MSALAWVAVALTVTIGSLWIFQRSLIYLPSQAVPAPPADVDQVSFMTEDGVVLSAWYMSADPERGVVAVFNGNAGNRSNRLPLAQALVNQGFSVLLTEYRGYGENPGSPSEQGLAFDARAAFGYLRERVGDLPLVYFGESLGAGVAIGLATEHPPTALILRSPFVSLPDIAAEHYWWLPSSRLLKDRFPNVERIGEIDVPVIVIAGSADTIVPPGQSQAVYDAAGQPKDFLLIGGAGHNDRELLDGEEMITGIVNFLNNATPP